MIIPLTTGFYAGLLGLLLLLLTARVGVTRRRLNVSLTDGGSKNLAVAIRQQGNLIELVPLCLILLAIMEMARTSIYVVHLLGVILLISRLIHPFGLDHERMNRWPRMIGAGGTMIVLLIVSCWTIYLFVLRTITVGL